MLLERLGGIPDRLAQPKKVHLFTRWGDMRKHIESRFITISNLNSVTCATKFSWPNFTLSHMYSIHMWSNVYADVYPTSTIYHSYGTHLESFLNLSVSLFWTRPILQITLFETITQVVSHCSPPTFPLPPSSLHPIPTSRFLHPPPALSRILRSQIPKLLRTKHHRKPGKRSTRSKWRHRCVVIYIELLRQPCVCGLWHLL